MSFRPKASKVTHLTMAEVKGIMQAKEDEKQVLKLEDQQLMEEMRRRGFEVKKS